MEFLARILMIFIVLVCQLPVKACDDCSCNSIETVTDSNCCEHEGCEGCCCSPFGNCSSCSGCVVSETLNFDALHFPLSFSLDFIMPEAHGVTLETVGFEFTDNYFLPPPEGHGVIFNKLRGSPLFS